MADTVTIERKPETTRFEASDLARRIERGYLDQVKIRELSVSEIAVIVAALQAYGR